MRACVNLIEIDCWKLPSLNAPDRKLMPTHPHRIRVRMCAKYEKKNNTLTLTNSLAIHWYAAHKKLHEKNIQKPSACA